MPLNSTSVKTAFEEKFQCEDLILHLLWPWKKKEKREEEQSPNHTGVWVKHTLTDQPTFCILLFPTMKRILNLCVKLCAVPGVYLQVFLATIATTFCMISRQLIPASFCEQQVYCQNLPPWTFDPPVRNKFNIMDNVCIQIILYKLPTIRNMQEDVFCFLFCFSHTLKPQLSWTEW